MLRFAFLSLLFASTAFAWGPHSEIAQAALDAMGPDDLLAKHLGADTKRLVQYVWMADNRQQLLSKGDEVFYADDVLLFPAATKHYDHLCPAVQQTYSPYFRRALQALRTESPHNAARWVGSLLHFTTDTGSPPHAASISGPVHSKMENWLNAKLIHIPGYKPQLLGSDDASAEAGFIRRMEGLIDFSKQRAERCRADVEADRREPVEPMVLESALETARVTADLLHTLGVLTAKGNGDSTLKGKVIAPKLDHPQLSRLLVKIVLRDTLYSTLASEDGTFSFAPLPAGEYHPVISAPGVVKDLPPVKLSAGSSIALDAVDLSAKTDGNLLRNPDFKLRWVSAEGFDHWNSRMPSGRLGGPKPVREWEGEKIPLQPGITNRLTVRWKSSAPAAEAPEVFVLTKAKPAYDSPPTDSAMLTPGKTELTVTGSADAAWGQVIIRTRGAPDTHIESVSLSATH
ncbi:MAG: hypothetical protein K1X78_25000 [Verrucomicrobiaceae bacterium]|nr:hypothetical protein [Verrucomicrobiaceae bacterium]